MKSFWRNHPELTKEFRTKAEDNLAKDIIIIYKKINSYLRKEDNYDTFNFSGDLQGAIHLLQMILIEVQKERYNNKI